MEEGDRDEDRSGHRGKDEELERRGRPQGLPQETSWGRGGCRGCIRM